MTDTVKEFSFGQFRLLPISRQLLQDDSPVPLGSRALDLLIALVSRAQDVVSKQELIRAAWPDTFVVEANLTVHVTALRRALGDGQGGNRYIINVPGRGYRFAAPVRLVKDSEGPRAELPQLPRNNLPAPLSRLIGREEVLSGLLARLQATRLLTIVGPPGIGKTSCAIALGRTVVDSFDGQTWFIDLSSTLDPRLIPGAIAAALRLQVFNELTVAGLIQMLHGRRMLIILDNCEHLIEDVADFAVAALRGIPELAVVATSREALRVEGEQVYRLEPLSLPQHGAYVQPDDIMAFAAIELFVERASAAAGKLRITDEDANAIARICRDLDGIPLAIEFAASRLGSLNLKGLQELLSHKIQLLGGNRRGVSRHRTMLAALDWSYNLLSGPEQKVLRALSVFSGGFTLAAAIAIGEVGHEDTTANIVLDLAQKSLLSIMSAGSAMRFRLLEITREYALGKLEIAGEAQLVRDRHANFFMRDLKEKNWNLPALEFVASASPEIDNVRAALAWVVAEQKDDQRVLQMAAAAAPLFIGLSLLAECRRWLTSAAERIRNEEHLTPDAMEVQGSLASVIYFTTGLTDEAFETWTRASRFAQRLGDLPRLLDSLVALWTFQIREPNYSEARALADRHTSVAAEAQDAAAAITSDWIHGTTYHHLGNLRAARKHFERFLAGETSEQRLGFVLRTGYDRKSASQAILANAMLLQGNIGDAISLAAQAVDEARALGKALPLCEALMWQATTLYLAGETQAAAKSAAEILEEAGAFFLDNHYAVGLCFKALSDEDSLAARIARMIDGIEGLDKSRYGPFHPLFVAETARLMAKNAESDEALRFISAYELRTFNPDSWCTTELLCAKAELQADPFIANRLYQEALELAGRQHAALLRVRVGISAASHGSAGTSRHLAKQVIKSEFDNHPDLAACPIGVVALDLLERDFPSENVISLQDRKPL